jgi:hypothetical protein
MSDERIRSRLIKEGYDKESVLSIKQTDELLEMLAECVVERTGLEVVDSEGMRLKEGRNNAERGREDKEEEKREREEERIR